MSIQYPRLLQTDGRTFVRPLHPIRASVELNIIPLSTASLELPEEEVIPARSYVEMFTNLGSAGIFRVRSPQNSYGEDQTASELEHAIVEVGDWLVRAKYDEMKPAGQAMQTIFNHYRGNKWQLGSVSALGSKSIALQANYDDCLSAMLALLDQVPDVMMTFDFSTSPKWTVSFAAVDSTVSAEGRMSRNIESARIIYDDSELCTRAYYEYPVAGSDDGTTAPSTAWATMDADTISTYGIIEREVPTGSGFTRSEAEYTVREYLRKHKQPKISIEMTAEDLSQMTGESLDTFRIGKLFRLALPKYGITVEKPITGMSWDDPYNNQREITINLADPEDTAITFLHDVNANGSSGAASGGGGGGGRRKKQDDEWKMYRHEWEVSDYRLFYEAQRWSRSEEILNKAGLRLNAFGALIYADDVENGIGARFNLTSQQITQEVHDATTQAALILSITNGKSNAKLTADVIDIDGDTVVGWLVGETINCDTVNCDGLDATNVNADILTANANVNAGEGFYDSGNRLKVLDVTKSGNTLTVTKVDGSFTFSKAATLQATYGGSNAGITATYTVTGSPADNFPSGATATGTFTLHLSAAAAYVTDPNGTIRARIANSYSESKYNEGWNACIDAARKLDVYTRSAGTYGGESITHYVNTTGQHFTGVGTNWYRTQAATAYSLPAKK